MSITFRRLYADEIDVRVNQITEKSVSVLLYKDARADMNILDETVGAENWQRRHARDNANCIVSIWDSEKGQWIEKEDTGTESNTEKEKGLASDSFKRACTNWGIGRELYKAPRIYIPLEKVDVRERNGKKVCYTRFAVKSIDYDAKGNITSLEITDEDGEPLYTYPKAKSKAAPKVEKTPKVEKPPLKVKTSTYDKLKAEIKRTNVRETDIGLKYNVTALSALTEAQAQEIIKKLATKPTMNAGA